MLQLTAMLTAAFRSFVYCCSSCLLDWCWRMTIVYCCSFDVELVIVIQIESVRRKRGMRLGWLVLRYQLKRQAAQHRTTQPVRAGLSKPPAKPLTCKPKPKPKHKHTTVFPSARRARRGVAQRPGRA